MRRLGPALALLFLVALVPAPAQGALNGDHAYLDVVPFANGLDDTQTFLSGAMTAGMQAEDGTFGFLDTTDLVMRGLDRVCWQQAGGFECETGTEIRLEVGLGGSLGMAVDGAGSLRLDADHALDFLVDLGDRQDLAGLEVGPSLVASMINGRVTQMRLPVADEMRLAAISDATTVHVIVDDRVAHSLEGKRVFQVDGAPTVGAFRSRFAVVPMGTGSNVDLTPAPPELVADGIDPLRVAALMQSLNGAASGQPADTGDLQLPDELQNMLAHVFDGAILRLGVEGETGNDVQSDMTLVRFNELTLRPDGTGKVLMEGDSPFEMQGGEVVGAPNTVGVGVVQLPWWSWVLLVVGVGLWITRMATRAPKKSERWDRWRIVGWLATPAALLLVFWLWDREMQAVWGASLLTAGQDGAITAGTLAILQLGSLALLFGAAVAPMQMVLRHGLRLARQGTFMALDRPIAILAGYLIGAPLLLLYLEFLMARLVEQLGG